MGEQSANMGCGASGEPVTKLRDLLLKSRQPRSRLQLISKTRSWKKPSKRSSNTAWYHRVKRLGPCQQEVRLGPIKWADISIRVYYPSSRPLPSPNSHLMLSLSKLHSAVCLLECSRRSATNSLLCSGKPASPLP